MKQRELMLLIDINATAPDVAPVGRDDVPERSARVPAGDGALGPSEPAARRTA